MDQTVAEALVRRAMTLATQTAARGNAPFGAVLATEGGAILLEAVNGQVTSNDPTAHAEIELIRAAARVLGRTTLEGLAIASNAESCSMCASALVKFGIGTIVYGAPHEPHMDPALALADVVARAANPPRVIGEVLADECRAGIAAARAETPAID
jgi:tRNA(adenine34) deaminase